MSDIVDLLRAEQPTGPDDIKFEAADEIERLRMVIRYAMMDAMNGEPTNPGPARAMFNAIASQCRAALEDGYDPRKLRDRLNSSVKETPKND